ncbi:MAG: glycogen synthase GlgA [candidate division WOR-3 bacterium]|nr:MAG: glycogen synthase GlgA [candidate division WOR-3 bacterium]
MKIAFIASEAVPYAKTGGLADVVGALPHSLTSLGIEPTIIMPRYKGMEGQKEWSSTIDISGKRRVDFYRHGKNLFVDNPDFFLRDGLYGDSEGDFPDNCERFTFFCKAAIMAVEKELFDIVHCHDWQSGLIPLYLKLKGIRSRSIFTIHNLGYQGRFSHSKFPILGIEKKYFSPDGLEFHGDMNFLKAGIVHADIVTTVSENYAEEIQTPDLGFGLDGILRTRARDLYGIINGIDYQQWNPKSDDMLYEKYDDFDGKEHNKARLCADYCIDPKKPLIGMVSRIAGQKGFDILLCALDEIMKMSCNMIILGFGEESYHHKLLKLQDIYHGRLCVNIKFDNKLAHRIYAGSDFFLMPSKYEPCGLGQLISLRYGTVPIVRRTGGLADTVNEFDINKMSGNGFLFLDYSGRALADAVQRARAVFSQPERFRKLSEQCMEYDYSWNKSAKKYAQLYADLLSS